MTKEAVNHPDHYGGEDNPYEVIKIIEAHQLNFNLGNTVKYILRARHKGKLIEDLKKALWYLEREIINLQGGFPFVPTSEPKIPDPHKYKNHWVQEHEGLKTWHFFPKELEPALCGRIISGSPRISPNRPFHTEVICKECDRQAQHLKLKKG